MTKSYDVSTSKKFDDLPPPSFEPSPTGGDDGLIESDRGNWGNPVEFILSCMNFAIGLGNVWRYPYLAYRNGGGAFLIPYFLAAVFIGLPVFFAELVVGQYSGLGPIKAFANLAPFFKGLGHCTLLVITFIEIYYFVIVAWCFYYFFISFFPDLRWGSCFHPFNTEFCYELYTDLFVCGVNNTNDVTDQHFFNRTCQSIDDICGDLGLTAIDGNNCNNATGDHNMTLHEVIPRTLSAEEFFYYGVLGMKYASWSNWGIPQWPNVLALFVAWALCAGAIIRGVKSVGKIVYFTATFPYFILTALLVRGLTLPGSMDGIQFYLTPEWSTLLSPQVWGDASSQIFYSFSLALGSLVTLASYNKFKNNCHFDAVFVSGVNYLTAFYAGFTVFAILGFLAYSMGADVADVATSGPGLSFVVFPEAILLMPAPQVWAILFFFMMIILGLGSTFAGIQMITTSIMDQWPQLRKKEWKVTIAVCASGFLCGLPMTCPGGIFLFTLMEWHTASWAILLIGCGEVVILSWVHGFNNTFNLIKEMGMHIWRWLKNFYWRSVWMVITPIYTVGIFIFILTGIEGMSFRGYEFPLWANILGWTIGFATLVPFIVFAIIQTIKYSMKGDFWGLFKPTQYWGPQEVNGRQIDRARMDSGH